MVIMKSSVLNHRIYVLKFQLNAFCVTLQIPILGTKLKGMNK
jgi:hypothetical protein